MNNITFIIFTYNEEKRISFAIRSFIKYGKVIIMDGGSTDKTEEIAISMGAEFYIRPNVSKAYVETQDNFEFVKEKAKTDWIYWGYVDNIASPLLINRVNDIISNNKFKMILVPLYTYLWGDVSNVCLKSRAPMFWHRDFMDFSDNYIHGMGRFIGSKKQICYLPMSKKYCLHHFSTYNTKKFVEGHLKYSQEEAIGKNARGKKYSTLRMLAAMFRYLWIYRRSLRRHPLGLIIVLNYAFFRLMAYSKLYEIENNIDLDSIEKKYSLQKEKILFESKL